MSLYAVPGRTCAIILLLLSLSSCQAYDSSAGNGELASGKLVSIGQKHLVMESGSHVMFVSVGEADKQRLLRSLKKGDTITLVGKRDTQAKSHGADVYEVVKSDGTRIALNH